MSSSMRVVITGAAGFLGNRLARRILERGHLIDAQGERRDVGELVLVDVVPPALAHADTTIVTGDLSDPALVASVLTADTDSVFHLAAVVSGQAEAEFDVGMRVNLDTTRVLLEHCRVLARPPKFVFASSLAVFGGTLPNPVPDNAVITPQSSYGTQKAVCELLISDWSRKGYIDGRSLRLPTVTVRPGKPNKAASSFASGIIREPLGGVDAVCPVAPTAAMWVQSPASVIENFLLGHDAPASHFAASRSVNVPGLCVSVREMVESLRRVAGDAVAGRVRWQLDPVIDRIVSTWPSNFTPVLGPAMGMKADADFDSIVRAYMSEQSARPAA